jgi:hypothetical protein
MVVSRNRDHLATYKVKCSSQFCSRPARVFRLLDEQSFHGSGKLSKEAKVATLKCGIGGANEDCTSRAKVVKAESCCGNNSSE